MTKIRQFLFTALLLLIAAGAGPAFSGVWQWSKNADNNAGSDPSIGWAEGMSPSSVNDSARAMMAQIANYRDDISGLLTTGGSSTAYTVTTNSGLCPSSTTPNDGQLLSITVNSTNGANATLTADACSAFPIQSSAGVAVSSASLVSGSPYSLRFSVANSAWMLKGFYSSATNVALGALVPFTLTTSPNSNFIFAYGQCISTITYATYWAALGSPGPGSCGANQFAVIDMRGNAPAGLDTMPGSSAAGRLTSSATGCGTAMTSVGARCSNGTESGTILTTNLPPYTPAGSVATTNVNGTNGAPITLFSGGGTTLLTGGGSQANGFLFGGPAGVTFASTFTGTPAAGQNSTPVPKVPPLVGVTYLLRVL